MIIVPLWRSASASASADLPLAVGPAMSATFGKGPMFIATLIAASLSKGEVSAARDRLDAAGCLPVAEAWVEQGEAIDLQFGRDPGAARGTLEGLGYDVVVQPAEHRRKMLLVADMDSTMITVECLDELADYAGIKAEVAAVTEAAMRGDLDFGAALDARVALLKGMDESVIERCLAERVLIMSGATTLVQTMRGWGATAILVSGGFTRFADPVAERIGHGDLSALLFAQGVARKDWAKV